MALHPQVRKQKLKLTSRKLALQARMAEDRDSLREVREQLKQLAPPKPKQEGV